MILGSLLQNLGTSTLPLLFETVVSVTVTVTLNWKKVTRNRRKATRYFPLLFVTFACMRPHVHYAMFKWLFQNTSKKLILKTANSVITSLTRSPLKSRREDAKAGAFASHNRSLPKNIEKCLRSTIVSVSGLVFRQTELRVKKWVRRRPNTSMFVE